MLQLIKLIFDIFFTLFGWITSLLSISAVESLPDFSKGIFYTVISIMCGIYGYIHISEFFDNRHTFKTQDKANDYLAKWIGTNTGKVFIYTNDVSWASSDKLRDILAKKARDGDLTMCLRTRSPEAKFLEQQGAKISILKGKIDAKARFIIVNPDSDDPKVSIYTTDGRRRYVNQQFDRQHNPVVREVFSDLYKFAQKYTFHKDGKGKGSHNS